MSSTQGIDDSNAAAVAILPTVHQVPTLVIIISSSLSSIIIIIIVIIIIIINIIIVLRAISVARFPRVSSRVGQYRPRAPVCGEVAWLTSVHTVCVRVCVRVLT
eukprot:3693138-Rhodomonas_salina.1